MIVLFIIIKNFDDVKDMCNTFRIFSAKQSGKLKNNVTPWPPFRPPTPVSAQYDDPRVVLGSKVFHAMIFVILYKAINNQNISEHVISLGIYLLEMAVETAEVPDKSVS